MVLVPFPKSKADEYKAKIELARSHEELMKIIADIEYDIQKTQNAEEKIKLMLVLAEGYLLTGYPDKTLDLINSIRNMVELSKELEEILINFEISAFNAKREHNKALEIINEYESKYGELPDTLKIRKMIIYINLGDFEKALQIYNQFDENILAEEEPLFFPALKKKLEAYKKAKELLSKDETFRTAFNILKEKGFNIVPVFDDEVREGMFLMYFHSDDPDEIVKKEDEAFSLILERVGKPYTVIAV